MERIRRLGLGLVVSGLVLIGCHTTAPAGTPCKSSAECPNGSGVCRNEMCGPVTCSMTMLCLAGEMCDTSGMCVPNAGKPCKSSADCAPGTGVCRNMVCAPVNCSMSMPCQGDEICANGKCSPAAKGTPGQTLAAGGSVATSGKHIHVGLTGQGRAVGTGSTAKHTHTTGATSVMGR